MAKQDNKKLPSIIILKTTIVAIGVLVVVHLLLQYLNLQVYNEASGRIFELSNRFDLDDESSVPTWFSQFLLLVVGMAAAVAAWLQTKKILKWIWGGLAFIAVAMSVDEVSTLHEHSLQQLHVYVFDEATPTITENAWLIVLPLVLFFTVTAGLALYKFFPRRTSLLLLLGGGMFLTGAVLVDALSTDMFSRTFLFQGLAVAVEETLELVGSAVILFAIVDYIERYRSKELAKKLQNLSARIAASR